MKTKKERLQELVERLGETPFDISVTGDMDGHTVIISDNNRQVLVDILDDSEWYFLEVYNPNKDAFHYTKKRKSIKAVINYTYKHLE